MQSEALARGEGPGGSAAEVDRDSHARHVFPRPRIGEHRGPRRRGVAEEIPEPGRARACSRAGRGARRDVERQRRAGRQRVRSKRLRDEHRGEGRVARAARGQHPVAETRERIDDRHRRESDRSAVEHRQLPIIGGSDRGVGGARGAGVAFGVERAGRRRVVQIDLTVDEVAVDLTLDVLRRRQRSARLGLHVVRRAALVVIEPRDNALTVARRVGAGIECLVGGHDERVRGEVLEAETRQKREVHGDREDLTRRHPVATLRPREGDDLARVVGGRGDVGRQRAAVGGHIGRGREIPLQELGQRVDEIVDCQESGAGVGERERPRQAAADAYDVARARLRLHDIHPVGSRFECEGGIRLLVDGGVQTVETLAHDRRGVRHLGRKRESRAVTLRLEHEHVERQLRRPVGGRSVVREDRTGCVAEGRANPDDIGGGHRREHCRRVVSALDPGGSDQGVDAHLIGAGGQRDRDVRSIGQPDRVPEVGILIGDRDLLRRRGRLPVGGVERHPDRRLQLALDERIRGDRLGERHVEQRTDQLHARAIGVAGHRRRPRGLEHRVVRLRDHGVVDLAGLHEFLGIRSLVLAHLGRHVEPQRRSRFDAASVCRRIRALVDDADADDARQIGRGERFGRRDRERASRERAVIGAVPQGHDRGLPVDLIGGQSEHQRLHGQLLVGVGDRVVLGVRERVGVPGVGGCEALGRRARFAGERIRHTQVRGARRAVVARVETEDDVRVALGRDVGRLGDRHRRRRRGLRHGHERRLIDQRDVVAVGVAASVGGRGPVAANRVHDASVGRVVEALVGRDPLLIESRGIPHHVAELPREECRSVLAHRRRREAGTRFRTRGIGARRARRVIRRVDDADARRTGGLLGR